MSSEELTNSNNVIAASKPEKVKRKKSKARKIVEWVLFSVFGLFFAFVLAGNISGEIHKKENYGQSIRFGVGSFIILTNSMEPEIPKDSAILTYKEDVSKVFANYLAGATIDITFANINTGINYQPADPKYNRPVVTNRVMTHRLVEMYEDTSVTYGYGRYIFVTAGINAGGESSEAGQYQVFTENQYLGVVKVTNTALGKVFNFIVSPVGLIIVLLVPAAYLIVVSSIDIFRALKMSEEQQEVAESSGRLAALKDDERERLKKELLDEMLASKRKEKERERHDSANYFLSCNHVGKLSACRCFYCVYYYCRLFAACF